MSATMQLSLLDGGCETVAPRRPELTLVPWPTGWRNLPVRTESQLAPRRRGVCVTAPGYHKGRKPGNAGRTYPPEPVTAKDVHRLLAATGGGYAGARDRALTVTILRGKGGKRRKVGLSAQTAEELGRWFEKRAELGLTDMHPVFPVISRPTVGKRLYASCVREQLRDCATRAGLRQRITPHCFRHGLAVDLVRRGVPINVISKVLGHSNSAITARYIDHVDGEEALDALRDRVWLVAA